MTKPEGCDDATFATCQSNIDDVPFCYRLYAEHDESPSPNNPPLIATNVFLERLASFGCNLECDSCVIKEVVDGGETAPALSDLGDYGPGIIKTLMRIRSRTNSDWIG